MLACRRKEHKHCGQYDFTTLNDPQQSSSGFWPSSETLLQGPKRFKGTWQFCSIWRKSPSIKRRRLPMNPTPQLKQGKKISWQPEKKGRKEEGGRRRRRRRQAAVSMDRTMVLLALLLLVSSASALDAQSELEDCINSLAILSPCESVNARGGTPSTDCCGSYKILKRYWPLCLCTFLREVAIKSSDYYSDHHADLYQVAQTCGVPRAVTDCPGTSSRSSYFALRRH
ncbi:hypothetical protein EJ110_NYTH47912 [Nymphaea thermarum]|nr:hypothetical protein EJ110_NYTH47912 [Nymphaea thermarum]